MNLSIVIPAYNEEESLAKLLDEIIPICESLSLEFEIIIVDDGSTDQTFNIVRTASAQDNRIHGFRFRRNCGKAAALSVGFGHCKGKYVITFDADLQDNPSEIPALLAKLDGGADMVSGWKKLRHDPWHKVIPSKAFNLLTRFISGLKLHDFNCGLKAYRREVVQTVNLYGELHRYIPVMANWEGFKVEEMVVDHRPRKFGKSKYGLARFKGVLDLLTVWFLHRYTMRPLHLFGLGGLLSSLIGFCILIYFAIDWLITSNLHLRPLLLGGIAFILVGIQFVSIGLLGELITQQSNAIYPIAETAGDESEDRR